MSCLDKAAFVVRFGEVYEHSPWVAEEVFDAAGDENFDTSTLSAEDLAARFESIFLNAPKKQQLGVLRAHPALAVEPAEHGHLTAQSSSEQVGAGLDQCTESEFALFQEMNAMYFGRFDFSIHHCGERPSTAGDPGYFSRASAEFRGRGVSGRAAPGVSDRAHPYRRYRQCPTQCLRQCPNSQKTTSI